MFFFRITSSYTAKPEAFLDSRLRIGAMFLPFFLATQKKLLDHPGGRFTLFCCPLYREHCSGQFRVLHSRRFFYFLVVTIILAFQAH